MPHPSLASALIKTLAWFSLTQYPLTTFECWRYLYADGVALPPATPLTIARALEQLAKAGVVRGENGFWRLASCATSIEQRLAQARVSIAKRRRALAGARLLARVPFVKFVGLGNTLALGAARPSSDIDLLIIMRREFLFLGRALATLAVQLAGWRRHGRQIANRLCLSFYLSESRLSLRALAYPDDPYLIFWLASLVPLLGAEAYAQLVGENQWVGGALPNWRGQKFMPAVAVACQPVVLARPRWAVWLEAAGSVLFRGWGEALARAFELFLIKRHPHSRLGDGTTAVVVTNQVLKFHESDRRPELASEWRARLAAVLS